MTFISVIKNNKKIEDYNKQAIHSWISISPKTHVILFADQSKVDNDNFIQNSYKDQLKFSQKIRHDFSNVPFVDDLFKEGVQQSRSKYVTFIRDDLILTKDWFNRVNQIFNFLSTQNPIIISQFVNVSNITAITDTTIDYTSSNADEIGSFTFRTGPSPFDISKVPGFVYGRGYWSNWMVGWLNSIADTVSIGLHPPAFRLQHSEKPLSDSDNRVIVNKYVKVSNGDYWGTNNDTKWKVEGNKLVNRKTLQEIELLDLTK
ncbi:glycosyl transferase family 2 [Histomonas meleagridis]|uniref:glycosyl transferase family 2 n=1 Tax=Histomonas meleagridis TaxID=135588 RepID=UPI00355A3DD0|nr:glycosyl transferase family 2 [Histomonas meleagridis]KAH0796361.1 glycosyl transferase family 2 [Histomonas meleagridis]